MEKLKTGIVICSRLDSKRIPEKPLQEIKGKSILSRLIERLKKTRLQIFIAVPKEQADRYSHFVEDGCILSFGDALDPLARMYKTAKESGLNTVVRVTHDKIFVDHDILERALTYFKNHRLEYLYCSGLIEGAGFEIISFDALEKAASRYANVEHISYSIKAVATRIADFNKQLKSTYKDDSIRLLIDYKKDIDLMKKIFKYLPDDCKLKDVIDLLNRRRPYLKDINTLPKLSIYTCCYNSEKYLVDCLASVASQTIFPKAEYIIVDDKSTDGSSAIIREFASIYPNVKVIKNEDNIGLASSSNIALGHARGRYLVRLDADDYFADRNSCQVLVNEMELTRKDIIYPDNFHGSFSKKQPGRQHHHVGGSIFNRKAINHIKFTDGLRGYEGLDFFVRAKNILKIGYLRRPIFFYRQHNSSMSKNNIQARQKLRSEILGNEKV